VGASASDACNDHPTEADLKEAKAARQDSLTGLAWRSPKGGNPALDLLGKAAGCDRSPVWLCARRHSGQCGMVLKPE